MPTTLLFGTRFAQILSSAVSPLLRVGVLVDLFNEDDVSARWKHELKDLVGRREERHSQRRRSPGCSSYQMKLDRPESGQLCDLCRNHTAKCQKQRAA
jgi:hypothetical protein